MFVGAVLQELANTDLKALLRLLTIRANKECFVDEKAFMCLNSKHIKNPLAVSVT